MKLYIPYEFDNWNQYIFKERSRKYWASAIKKKESQIVEQYCNGITYDGEYPIKITITKYFATKRQDLDNVRIKGVLDGLVKCGVLKNDNLSCITKIELLAKIDKEKIGLELEIEPYEDFN